MTEFTCWSCMHYRPTHCDLDMPRYPFIGVECPVFSYEPGSDEAET